MEINITGHHLETTDALRDFVIEKTHKLEQHKKDITSLEVILTVEHTMHIAEATANIPHMRLHARAEEKDMYAAIQALVMKLDKQLIKHKEKHAKH